MGARRRRLPGRSQLCAPQLGLRVARHCTRHRLNPFETVEACRAARDGRSYDSRTSSPRRNSGFAEYGAMCDPCVAGAVGVNAPTSYASIIWPYRVAPPRLPRPPPPADRTLVMLARPKSVTKRLEVRVGGAWCMCKPASVVDGGGGADSTCARRASCHDADASTATRPRRFSSTFSTYLSLSSSATASGACLSSGSAHKNW
eukprot:347947-Chlamydomonas_euryale.AAC.15